MGDQLDVMFSDEDKLKRNRLQKLYSLQFQLNLLILDDHTKDSFCLVVPHTEIMREVVDDFQDNDVMKHISIESHYARILLTQFCLSIFSLLHETYGWTLGIKLEERMFYDRCVDLH